MAFFNSAVTVLQTLIDRNPLFPKVKFSVCISFEADDIQTEIV